VEVAQAVCWKWASDRSARPCRRSATADAGVRARGYETMREHTPETGSGIVSSPNAAVDAAKDREPAARPGHRRYPARGMP
jgi:hypothetical protein